MMIRRQSLRPRQIDNHGKMRIIRSVQDLAEEEDGVTGQKITSLEDLNSLIEDKPSKSRRKSKAKSIPIPVNTIVKTYEKDVPADFQIPTSYVRFQTVPQEGDEAKVEVDLDLQDMEWLRTHPKYGENGDPRYQLPLETFNAMIDVLEKASGPITPNLVTQAEAEALFKSRLNMMRTPPNPVTLDVFNYWVQRRHQLKKPFLRRFWPQTPLNDTNPHLVFRPREKERYKLRKHRKNDLEGFRKMQLLRNDFQRARAMLKLIRRREKCKRLLVDYLDETRKQTIYEMTNRSGVPRTPRIPAEEDRDKRSKKLKKMKKLKKLKKGHEGESSPTQLLTTPGSTVSSSTVVKDLPLPSFMEYDVSANSIQTTSPLQTLPNFPTYPSYSELVPSTLPGPPRYKSRARIGRGGRLLIDRVALPSRYTTVLTEEYVRPPAALRKPSPAPQPETNPTIEPVTPRVSSFCGFPKIDSRRLAEIYAMEDSEDELTDLVGTTTLTDIAKPKMDPARPVKYTLNV